jgi:hypothetical protein
VKICLEKNNENGKSDIEEEILSGRMILVSSLSTKYNLLICHRCITLSQDKTFNEKYSVMLNIDVLKY